MELIKILNTQIHKWFEYLEEAQSDWEKTYILQRIIETTEDLRTACIEENVSVNEYVPEFEKKLEVSTGHIY